MVNNDIIDYPTISWGYDNSLWGPPPWPIETATDTTVNITWPTEREYPWRYEGKDLVARINLPGHTKESVEVTVRHGLGVDVVASSSKDYVKDVTRKLYLPYGNPREITATLEDGILTLRVEEYEGAETRLVIH